MEMTKSTGAWKSFLVSFILPVIGGLIVYFRNRNSNKQLADICLILSIFHPLVVLLGTGFLIGYYGGLYGLISYETEFPWWFGHVVGLLVFLIVTIVLVKYFSQNVYKYFVPVWYLGLIGAIYSYFAYKENKSLQKDVVWFVLGLILLLPLLSLLIILIGGGMYYFLSLYFQEKAKDLLIVSHNISRNF